MTAYKQVFTALIGLSAMAAFSGTTVAADAKKGKEVFERICAECHGPMGEGDKGPPLVPLLHQPDGMIAIARAGKGEMPPWPRATVSDDEIRIVAAYLKSLGDGS